MQLEDSKVQIVCAEFAAAKQHLSNAKVALRCDVGSVPIVFVERGSTIKAWRRHFSIW